jgi:hypothetical protein
MLLRVRAATTATANRASPIVETDTVWAMMYRLPTRPETRNQRGMVRLRQTDPTRPQPALAAGMDTLAMAMIARAVAMLSRPAGSTAPRCAADAEVIRACRGISSPAPAAAASGSATAAGGRGFTKGPSTGASRDGGA